MPGRSAAGVRLLLGTLVLGAAASPCAAQHLVARVEVGDRAAREVNPGEYLTLPFVVVGGTAAGTMETGTELPQGWRVLQQERPFTLAAGARALRLVSVVVPGDAPAGEYWVRHGIQHESQLRRESIDSVMVRVRRRSRVRVVAVESPSFVLAGEPYTATFRVSNDGNVNAEVALEASSDQRFGVRIDSTRLMLAPGAERVLVAAVDTDARLRAALEHHLRLRARVVGAPSDTPQDATATARVTVVPPDAENGRYIWPAQLRLRAAGDDMRGLRAEITGGGLIRAGSDTRVDLVIRPPQPNSPLAFEPAEYRLGVQGTGYRLMAGDAWMEVSRLTGTVLHARGAMGHVQRGRWSMGALAGRERWQQDGVVRAGYLRLQPNPAWRLGLTHLAEEGRRQGQVWTMAAAGPLGAATKVEAELGVGSGPEGLGTARTVSLYRSGSSMQFHIRHLATDPRVPLLAGPDRQTQAGVAGRGPLGVLLEAQLEEEAMRWSAQRDAKPLIERSMRLGASAQGIYLGYQRTSADGTAFQEPVGAWMHLATLRARAGGTSSGALMRAEIGATRDGVRNVQEPVRRLRLDLYRSVWTQGRVSTFAEHFRGRDHVAGYARERLSGGMDVAIRWGGALSTALTLQATRERQLGAHQRVQGIAMPSVAYGLPRGHELSARGQIRFGSTYAFESQPTVLLEYRVPFGVPAAAPIGERSQVRGRIVDAETGRGIARVMVRLGSRVDVTDSKGRFIFANVAAGEHHLHVDRGQIGVGRTPLRELPMRLQVADGATQVVDLAVVRSVRVRGRIELVRDSAAIGRTAGYPAGAQVGVGGTVVSLTREGDEQVHRRVTNASGHFDLSDLRPGRWHVRLQQTELPPHHRVEPGEVVVDLAPGEEAEVQIRVVPIRRRIRMIAEDALTEADAAPFQSQSPRLQRR